MTVGAASPIVVGVPRRLLFDTFDGTGPVDGRAYGSDYTLGTWQRIGGTGSAQVFGGSLLADGTLRISDLISQPGGRTRVTIAYRAYAGLDAIYANENGIYIEAHATTDPVTWTGVYQSVNVGVARIDNVGASFIYVWDDAAYWGEQNAGVPAGTETTILSGEGPTRILVVDIEPSLVSITEDGLPVTSFVPGISLTQAISYLTFIPRNVAIESVEVVNLDDPSTPFGVPTSAELVPPSVCQVQPFSSTASAPVTLFYDEFNSGGPSFDAARPMGYSLDPARPWDSRSAGISLEEWGGVYASMMRLDAFALPWVPSTIQADYALRYFTGTSPTTRVVLSVQWRDLDLWNEYAELSFEINFTNGTTEVYYYYEKWDPETSIFTYEESTTGVVPNGAVAPMATNTPFTVAFVADASSANILLNGVAVSTLAEPAFWQEKYTQPSIPLVDIAQTTTNLGVDSFSAVATSPAAPAELTLLGAPQSASVTTASTLGQVTKVSKAYMPFVQLGRASGFKSGGLGSGYSPVNGSAATHSVVSAHGFKATQFGQSAALAFSAMSAAGFMSGGVGYPVLRGGTRADGFVVAQVGAPELVPAHVGFGYALFGAPTAARITHANPLYRLKFGTPKSDILGTQKARGTAGTRLGRPVCRVGQVRQAVGAAGVAFGLPASTNVYRALHTPPTVRFGRGLLLRSPAC